MFNGQFNRNLPARNACYGCVDRFVGCHGSCGRYLAFKKRVEQSRAERAAFVKGSDDIEAVKRGARRRG